jgi:hypothetical protein
LEAPVEGFFWNLLEFGSHIRFDVLHVCEFLAKESIPVTTQPLYSLDLALSDLAVPYSENGPQENALRNHSGHQIECDG